MTAYIDKYTWNNNISLELSISRKKSLNFYLEKLFMINFIDQDYEVYI